jgi:hypothetical protein
LSLPRFSDWRLSCNCIAGQAQVGSMYWQRITQITYIYMRIYFRTESKLACVHSPLQYVRWDARELMGSCVDQASDNTIPHTASIHARAILGSTLKGLLQLGIFGCSWKPQHGCIVVITQDLRRPCHARTAMLWGRGGLY